MHHLTSVFVPSIVAGALLLASCKSQIDDKPAAAVKDAKPNTAKADGGVAKAGVGSDAKPAVGGKGLAVDASASSIGFVGAKVTDDHEGKFSDFTGDVAIEGDKVTSIALDVKTQSIDVEPQKLEDHMRSADFFDVETYPTATFKSTSITEKPDGQNTHLIEGTLDLRGVAKTITFPAKIVVEKGQASGTAEFTINRKDFGIVYAGMPDDLIKDEVLLKIDLKIPRS